MTTYDPFAEKYSSQPNSSDSNSTPQKAAPKSKYNLFRSEEDIVKSINQLSRYIDDNSQPIQSFGRELFVTPLATIEHFTPGIPEKYRILEHAEKALLPKKSTILSKFGATAGMIVDPLSGLVKAPAAALKFASKAPIAAKMARGALSGALHTGGQGTNLGDVGLNAALGSAGPLVGSGLGSLKRIPNIEKMSSSTEQFLKQTATGSPKVAERVLRDITKSRPITDVKRAIRTLEQRAKDVGGHTPAVLHLPDKAASILEDANKRVGNKSVIDMVKHTIANANSGAKKAMTSLVSNPESTGQDLIERTLHKRGVEANKLFPKVYGDTVGDVDENAVKQLFSPKNKKFIETAINKIPETNTIANFSHEQAIVPDLKRMLDAHNVYNNAEAIAAERLKNTPKLLGANGKPLKLTPQAAEAEAEKIRQAAVDEISKTAGGAWHVLSKVSDRDLNPSDLTFKDLAQEETRNVFQKTAKSTPSLREPIDKYAKHSRMADAVENGAHWYQTVASNLKGSEILEGLTNIKRQISQMSQDERKLAGESFAKHYIEQLSDKNNKEVISDLVSSDRIKEIGEALLGPKFKTTLSKIQSHLDEIYRVQPYTNLNLSEVKLGSGLTDIAEEAAKSIASPLGKGVRELNTFGKLAHELMQPGYLKNAAGSRETQRVLTEASPKEIADLVRKARIHRVRKYKTNKSLNNEVSRMIPPEKSAALTDALKRPINTQDEGE